MTLGNLEKLIQSEKIKVQKVLNHLNYSLKKIGALGTDINLDVLEDLEKLEVWESFTSRFSRLSDIVSKKLIRSLVLKGDPKKILNTTFINANL